MGIVQFDWIEQTMKNQWEVGKQSVQVKKNRLRWTKGEKNKEPEKG